MGEVGRRLLWLAAILAAALATSSSPALAKGTGTVAGKLSGAPIPSSAVGIASVRAIALDSGAIAGARRVGRSGSFTMTLPPGAYVLDATSIDRRTGRMLSGTSPPLTLAARQRRSLSVVMKGAKAKRSRGAARSSEAGATARSAYVRRSGRETPGVTAIEVHDFSGASGTLAAMNRALPELLQTDMLGAAAAKCPAVLLANARQRKAIAGKFTLDKSPYVGRTRRVRRDLLLADVAVDGRLTSLRGDALGYEITISYIRSGRPIESASGEISLDNDFFARAARIGPDLMDRICSPPLAPESPATPAPPLARPASPPPEPPPPIPRDKVAPLITLTSPASGSYSTDTTPTFAGIAGTADGDSTSVTVRIFSGSLATGVPVKTLLTERGLGGDYAVDSEPLAPGLYAARAEQSDDAGNTGLSSPVTFAILAPGADPVMIGAGDIAGCGSSDGDGKTAALLDLYPSAIVFTLGDNAYVNGQPSEYANCYDPTWGRERGRTRPITGGHDVANVPGGALPNQGFSDYFSAQLAQFGATATDRLKAYYSYDVGAWHIVALNSSCYHLLPGCDAAAMEAWFRQDLAAHPSFCTAVMWHASRWSSGSVHGSQLFMQPLWDIAYSNGVDVVLGGLEHDYERFAPQDANGALDTTYGVRAFVVGTGGYYLYTLGTRLPNSEAWASTYGVLKLTLHVTGYDWQFIPIDGQTFTDSGTGSCHDAPPQPAGTPTVRSSASNSAPFRSTSLTINKPNGAQAGDVLVAMLSHQGGSSRDIEPPAGWTEVPNTHVSEGTNAGMQSFYRVATGSEPGSYEFELARGSGESIAGGIMAIRDADTDAPINASASLVQGPPNAPTLTAPSVTTTRPNTLLLYGGATSTAVTFTPPQLMPEQWDVTAGGDYKVSTEGAAGGLAAAGPTGTRTATLSSAARGVAMTIAIAPSPGG